MPYQIPIDPHAKIELRRLRKHDQTMILDEAEKYLTWEPMKEQGTRIRELTQPAVSQFRLRVGDCRVYVSIFYSDVANLVAKGRERSLLAPLGETCRSCRAIRFVPTVTGTARRPFPTRGCEVGDIRIENAH
ncbi:MAG: hypothetical protein HY318_02820, partial [Armatimonadetes bacterium]|nr:hypothetical protein [Armatimonadota bacterium]